MIITGKALTLTIDNIDTDQIIAAEHLKTLTQAGLGKHAFANLLQACPALTDVERADAPILVAGRNFGCGSSREHAVWAMLDRGIKAVIAPSFSDIFASNAFKNGLLAIVLDEGDIAKLLEFTADQPVTIELDAQMVRSGDLSLRFELDPFRRDCLLTGCDEISLTLQEEPAITAYELRASI